MTEKELLYVEDTINHLKQTIKKCERYENLIQNEKLRSVICDLKHQHETLYNNVFNLL